MRGRENAFLEKRHPKQVLIIGQTAAAALQVWLLDVNRVAKLGMTRDLILHPPLDVFANVAAHAVLPKGLAKSSCQGGIARERARFEHRGFGEHVLVRLRDRLTDRARGMADLEPDVPEQIQDLLDNLPGVGRNRAAILMEKHDVDVAKRIQLPSPITAERDHGERNRCDRAANGGADSRLKNVLQQNIDQLDPKRADFPPAAD